MVSTKYSNHLNTRFIWIPDLLVSGIHMVEPFEIWSGFQMELHYKNNILHITLFFQSIHFMSMFLQAIANTGCWALVKYTKPTHTHVHFFHLIQGILDQGIFHLYYCIEISLSTRNRFVKMFSFFRFQQFCSETASQRF